MPLIFLNILLIIFVFSLDQGEQKSFGTKGKDGVSSVHLGEGFAGILEEQRGVGLPVNTVAGDGGMKPKKKSADRKTDRTRFLNAGHRPAERELVQGEISGGLACYKEFARKLYF